MRFLSVGEALREALGVRPEPVAPLWRHSLELLKMDYQKSGSDSHLIPFALRKNGKSRAAPPQDSAPLIVDGSATSIEARWERAGKASKPLHELGVGRCHWPLKTPPSEPLTLFCAAVAAEGSPWCPRHRSIAVAPVAPRRIVVPKDQRMLVFAAPADVEVDELVEIAA
jgi:hypothetical protein